MISPANSSVKATRNLRPARTLRVIPSSPSTSKVIAKSLSDGQRVLAIDPFYFGESKISKRDFLYGLLVSSV